MKAEPEHRAMRRAFSEQRSNATQRGILFLFSFEEWRAWWLTDSRWARRGCRRDDLMMCRFNDEGAYEPGNIYAGTHRDNSNEERLRQWHRQHTAEWHKHNVTHLKGKTGAAHPRSKPVTTPAGTFSSLAAAAAHFGVSTKEVWRRLATEEYRYAR